MKINEVSFKPVGNSASTQLKGSCHDNKSERVQNNAQQTGIGCSAFLLPLVNGHSMPLQRKTFAEPLLHRLRYSIKTYLHK